MSDYKELREALPKATHGPWDVNGDPSKGYVHCDDGLGSAVLTIIGLKTPLISTHQHILDLAYSAAANPATIAALLAEVDAWRERFRGYRYRPQDDCIEIQTVPMEKAE